MLGYHGQARILGANDPGVNEILLNLLGFLHNAARALQLGGKLLSTRQLNLLP